MNDNRIQGKMNIKKNHMNKMSYEKKNDENKTLKKNVSVQLRVEPAER